MKKEEQNKLEKMIESLPKPLDIGVEQSRITSFRKKLETLTMKYDISQFNSTAQLLKKTVDETDGFINPKLPQNISEEITQVKNSTLEKLINLQNDTSLSSAELQSELSFIGQEYGRILQKMEKLITGQK